MRKSIHLKQHLYELRKCDKEFHTEREKRYQERFKAQEEAIRVADKRLEEYKAQANEWRAQSKDREDTFVKKEVHDTFVKSMDEKVTLLTKMMWIAIGMLIVIEFILSKYSQ